MLKYYTIQVKSRFEKKYTELFKLLYPALPFTLFAPQRTLNIRRQGVTRQTVSPVFPGYVFVETEEEDDITGHKRAFRRVSGFYRFLKSNQNISPLTGRDLELVLHFIKKAGPVAGLSRVYFNEESRIIVTEGPLLGLEGKIIKVDKRKGRAKIKLDLYDDSFTIDLPFEIIGRI
jgi:transcriptional antiterminator NusG